MACVRTLEISYSINRDVIGPIECLYHCVISNDQIRQRMQIPS